MTAPILHLPASAAPASLQLGPYGVQVLISEAEELSMTCYRISVAPEQATATSYHLQAEEIYYILAGAGEAILDHETHTLAVGDFLRLPPGTRHSFRAGSSGLTMLDIHSPGSRPDRDVYFEGGTPEGFTPR